MKGIFKVLIDEEIYEYDNTDDIPEFFDNLICFDPEYPPGPHTEEQHAEIEQYSNLLMDFFNKAGMKPDETEQNEEIS